MNSALLPDPNTILSVDTPNAYVSEPAQRRLDAIRSSVDVRLAALEAALLDPARAEALESLILDLARVACDEAQAAAAHACVDARLEAEMHIAQARAAAQAVVDQEFASSAEVRRALEAARQQILVLEEEKDETLRQARDTFELELARERGAKTEVERTASTLERSMAHAQHELTSERKLTSHLREELDRIDGHARALTQQQAEAVAVRERVEAELGRAREAIAEGQRSHSETQAQLAIERNAVSELRRAADKTAEHIAALGWRESEARTAHEHITAVYDETVAGLQRERQAYAELRQAHKQLQAQADADQSASAQITRTQSELQQRLTSEESTVSDLKRALATLQDRFDAEQNVSARQTRTESELRAQIEAEQAALADMKQAFAELQDSLDAERATTSELRRAAAQADARMQAAIETEHALRAQLADTAKERKHAAQAPGAEVAQLAAANRQLATLTVDLEAERRLLADLKSQHADSEKRWQSEQSARADRTAEQLATVNAKLDAEQHASADLKRKHAELETRIAAEQRASADLKRRHAELETRIDAERTASAELRQEIVRVEERSHAGGQDVQAVRDALAHARSEVQTLRDELEAARTRVETLVGERADAERSWGEAESRLKHAARERDELAAKLAASRTHEVATKAARADDIASTTIPTATPLMVLPAPAYRTPGRQPGKAPARSKQADTGWVAVRMAPRYSFPGPMAVQVNGTPSQLCDLSVGGCQVLSLTAVKPNQTVKVLLPAQSKPITCTGKIVWAKLEAPALGRPAGYRAGVQFIKPDQDAIEEFLITQRATAVD
jgi:chromosome segregation ATPase